MRPILSLAGLLMAAEAAGAECADLPLCSRLGAPEVVFFAGEAVAERHRDGRQPEYLFRVRELLVGLPRETESVVVETSEGPPHEELLLLQARRREDGTLVRGECDYATTVRAAGEALSTLRRLAWAEGSLVVKVKDAHGRTPETARLIADGPVSRGADRGGQFPPLPTGDYRITASASGYETRTRAVMLRAGSCLEVELPLPGTAEIAGWINSGATVHVVDADSGTDLPILSTVPVDGRYRITGLPPGRYLIRAGAIFYPGTPHRIDAAIIQTGPGQKVELKAWNLR